MKRYLLLFLISTQSFAYTYLTSRYKFPTASIAVDVTTDDCSNAGINSSQELLALAYSAVNKFWNGNPTSALNISQGRVVSTTSTGDTSTNALAAKGRANAILVGCNGDVSGFNDASKGILAIGGIDCSSGSCKGAAIINAHANTTVDDRPRGELLTIIAHEVGHALGIGHSEDSIALMSYTISGKTQEYLAQDDIDAINDLYPQDKKMMGLFGSCATIHDQSDPPSSGGGFLFSILLGLILVWGGTKILWFRNLKLFVS